VSWQCGVAPVAAREHVRVARRLQELPLIREAFAAGQLSYSKVRALTRVEDVAREQELLATTAAASRVVPQPAWTPITSLSAGERLDLELGVDALLAFAPPVLEPPGI
jgi:hypothetical protein